MKQRNLKRMIAVLLAGIMIVTNINVTPVMAGETKTVEEVFFEDDFSNGANNTDLLQEGRWTDHSPAHGAKNSGLTLGTVDDNKVLAFTGNKTFGGGPRLMKAIDVTGVENLSVEFDVKLIDDAYPLQVGVTTDMTNQYVTLKPLFWKGGSAGEWTTCKLDFTIDGSTVTSKAYKKTGSEWVADTAYEDVSYTLTDNKIYLNFYAASVTSAYVVYIDNVRMYTSHEVEYEEERTFKADFENTSNAAELLATGWTNHSVGATNSNI